MADTPKYGGNKIDAMQVAGKLEAIQPQIDELKEKVKAKEADAKASETEAAAEEKASGPAATGGQVGNRRKVTQAIAEQTKAIEANAKILSLESQALKANTDLWLANAEARKRAAAVQVQQVLTTPVAPAPAAAPKAAEPTSTIPLPGYGAQGQVKLTSKQLGILTSEEIAQGIAGASKGQVQAFKQLSKLGLIEEFKGLGYGLTQMGEQLQTVIAGSGGLAAAAKGAGAAQVSAAEASTAALTAQAAATSRLAAAERARAEIPTYTGLTLGEPAGGSNDARHATNAAGERFIVKQYGGDLDRISTELLGNQVYRELGVRTPAAGLTYVGNKPALAVPFVEGAAPQHITAPTRDLQRGLAADALIANWDIYGTPSTGVHENVLFDQAGRAIRIDQGATFAYKGLGGKKPYGTTPSELQTLPERNPNIYGALSDDEIRAQTGRAARRITPARVDEMIGGLPFSPELATQIEQGMKGRLDFYKRYAEGKVAIDGTLIESAKSTSTAEVSAASAAAEAEALKAAQIEAAQKKLISSYDLSYGERAALAAPTGSAGAFAPVGVPSTGFDTQKRSRFYQRLFRQGLINQPEGGGLTSSGDELLAALQAHPEVGKTPAAVAIDEAAAYGAAGAFGLPGGRSLAEVQSIFHLPSSANETQALKAIKAPFSGGYASHETIHSLLAGLGGEGYTGPQRKVITELIENRSRAIARLEGLINEEGNFTAYRAGPLGDKQLSEGVARYSARPIPYFEASKRQNAHVIEQAPEIALRGYGPAVAQPGFAYETEEELALSSKRARKALEDQAKRRFDAAAVTAATTTPELVQGLAAPEINDLLASRVLGGQGKYTKPLIAKPESIKALHERGLAYGSSQYVGLTTEGNRVADELLEQRVLGYEKFVHPEQRGATGTTEYDDAYPGKPNPEQQKLVNRLEELRTSTSTGKIGGLTVPTTVKHVGQLADVPEGTVKQVGHLTAAKEALIGRLALQAEAGEALALAKYGKPGAGFSGEALSELQEKGLAKGYGLTGKGLVAADAFQAHVAKKGSYSIADAYGYQQSLGVEAEGSLKKATQGFSEDMKAQLAAAQKAAKELGYPMTAAQAKLLGFGIPTTGAAAAAELQSLHPDLFAPGAGLHEIGFSSGKGFSAVGTEVRKQMVEAAEAAPTAAATVVQADESMAASATARAEAETVATSKSISVREALARIAAIQAGGGGGIPPKLPPTLYGEPVGPEFEGPGRRLLGAGPVGGYGIPPVKVLGDRRTFIGGPGGVAKAPTVEFAPGVEAPARLSTDGEIARIGQLTQAEEKAAAVRARYLGGARSIAGEEARIAAASRQAAAELASYSTRLSRHGALSTEFIGSLARGEVTLREFGEATVATIGKFGGWAVAGGLVYGAYEAIKTAAGGAKNLSTEATQLERAGIPHFSRSQAESGLLSASRRLNVPIGGEGSIGQAQFYATRAGFRDQKESLKVGETAVEAEKLDLVPVQQAAVAFGALHVAFGLNAGQVHTIFEELDVGQLRFNARLQATLPFIQRSASAIANAGGNVHELAQQLIAVVGATGGSGGQGGGNPATLFIREPGNIRRPSSQAVLREIVPDILKRQEEHPDITRFNKELAERAIHLSPPERLAVAQSIGGGTALTRYAIPLVNSGPSGRLKEIEEQAGHPGDALARDLGKKLSQFDEQAKKIPLTFERLGAELGKIGLTRAVQDAVTLTGTFGSAVEKTAKPFSALGEAFEGLGPQVQDVVLVLGALSLATKFARSEKGIGLAKPAAEAFGKVPIVGGALGGYLDRPDKQLVRGATRTLSEEEAALRRRSEALSQQRLDANFNRQYAVRAEAAVAAESRKLAPAGEKDAFYTTEKGKALTERQIAAQQRTAAAEAAEAELKEQQVFLQQQISKNLGLRAIATAKSVTFEQKANELALQGFVLAGKGGLVIGAKGPEGAAYEAAKREHAEGRVPYVIGQQRGVEAVDIALEADAAKIAAGGTAIAAASVTSSERAKTGGVELAIALEQIALIVRREGGSLGVALRAARSGLREAGAGSAGVAGGYLSRVGGAVGKNLIPAALGAYLGVGAAEIGGSIIGGNVGKQVTDFGTAGAIGYGVGKLAVPALAAGKIAAFTGPEGQAIAAAGAISFEGGKKLAEIINPKKPEKTKLEDEAEKRQVEERRVNLENERAERGYHKPGSPGARFEEKFAAPTKAEPDETLNDATQGFTELLKEEFEKKGEAADKSKKEIDSAIGEAATTIKFYTPGRGRGHQAVQTLQGFNRAAIKAIVTDAKQQPQKIAELLKGIETTTNELTAQQTKDLSRARTPKQVAKATAPVRNFAQSEYEHFKKFGENLHHQLGAAETAQAKIENELANLPANRGTQQKRKELRGSLQKARETISNLAASLSEFAAVAPGVFDALNAVAAAANEAGFTTQKETDESLEKKELFDAGADTKKQREIKRRGAERLKRNIAKNLPGTHGETGRGPALQDKHEKDVTTGREAEKEGLERIEEDNRLKISRIPEKDEAGRARATKAGAERVEKFLQQHAKSGTFTWKEIEDGLIASNEAQEAGGKAAEDESSAIASAEASLAQARDQGNARAQAQDSITAAQRAIALAKHPAERIEAEAQLVQAHNQVKEAEAKHIDLIQQTRESYTADPLKHADQKVRADREKLKRGAYVGPEGKQELQNQVRNDIRSAKEAHISDEEEEVSFLEKTHRIGQDEAIRKLQHVLARLKKIGASKQRIRQVEEEIQTSQEQGDRDFAVGNIAFAPTLYDAKTLSRVRTPVATHALPAEGPRVIGQHAQPTTHGTAHHERPRAHIAQHNSIHISISGGHPGQFAAEMERVFGTLTRSQLRSLGLT